MKPFWIWWRELFGYTCWACPACEVKLAWKGTEATVDERVWKAARDHLSKHRDSEGPQPPEEP